MEIIEHIEKNEKGENKIMVWITASESRILDPCLQNYTKYDERNAPYMETLKGLREGCHKIRGLLNPS